MKFNVSALGLLIAASLLAAEPASIYHGTPSSPSASTRQGWIDFNKDGKKNPYEDATQPVARRVKDLLGRMTVEEKLGQLWQPQLNNDAVEKHSAHLQAGDISSFLAGGELVETPAMRNQLQRIAVEQSRLGIPLIFGHDVIHGFRTVFPIPLAQAAAWEPELFERTQAIAAREAAAAGIDWSFAPMVDLARDPRWGRIAEGFGEDPWLGLLNAAASVRGFQGTNVADADRVVACVKHFVGYGAAEGGRDYNTTEISEYTLRNFYLPQFKAGIDAGALTLMSAFNCLSGFPASGNRRMLTGILRDEWKFPGFVVSDYESVGELIMHGVATDPAEAARLGLNAGVDMEMVSMTYRDTVKQQVQDGKISKKVLDEAVQRVLAVKFQKGLFENPYTDEARVEAAFLRPDAIALAREAAAKSCVLLKNENAALPLSRQVKSLALIGPLANNAEEIVGCWSSRAHSNEIVTLAAGIRAKLSNDAELKIARGCRLADGGKLVRHLDGKPVNAPPTGTNEIAEAVELARAADAVVLALGEPRDWGGEDGCRTDLILTGQQMKLLNAVAATGKPVVVVLFAGRPLALTELQDQAAAILMAWHPGVQGGHGVADILFGDTEPAGRLTATFPRNVGQVPFHYNHFNTGRPGFDSFKGNYADAPTTPLYPFGFGLGYTTFEFGKVALETNSIAMNGEVTARTEIKNTGSQTGTTVAQLYLRDLAATAGPRPVRELKGFQKISLRPGEARTMKFSLSAKELGYFDTQGKWLVEPGKFQIWISADSASGEPAEFELKP